MSMFTGNCSNLQWVVGTIGLCEGARFFFDIVVGATYLVLIEAAIGDVNAVVKMAPPPVVNDFCENALPLEVGATVFANMTYATSDIVDDDCLDIAIYENFPGVWYKFVGNGKRLEARSCNSSSVFLTTIAILEGSCGVQRCLAATNERCTSAGFTFDTVQGSTYYVLLRSNHALIDDDAVVDLTVGVDLTPGNDMCANAQPISIGSRVRANFNSATPQQPSLYCNRRLEGTRSYPDLWYTVVGNGKNLSARLNLFCDCSEDTVIMIFNSGCDVVTPTCVAGTNYLCKRHHLLFETVKDTTYHVVVKSPNPDSVVDFTIATCGLFRLGMFFPKAPAEFLRDLLPCYFGGDCCFYDEC